MDSSIIDKLSEQHLFEVLIILILVSNAYRLWRDKNAIEELRGELKGCKQALETIIASLDKFRD